MLNLLDPSEFVKRFVSTITLTKEDRDLFDQGKIQNAKITAIADFVKEAGSDSVNESALLEKIKSFKFPEITSKAPKPKKKAPAKKKTKKKKPSERKELEGREDDLLEEEQSLIEEQKQLVKQIEEAKKNIQEKKEKASKKPKAPKTKKPTPSVIKEEEEVFEEETEEGVEPVLEEGSEETEDISEETFEKLEPVVEESEREQNLRALKQELEKEEQILESLKEKLKILESRKSELTKTRDELKKNLKELPEEEEEFEEESEEEEEVEEESEEEFVFGEGLTLDELSNQISDFIDDATSQSEIDALRGIVKEFRSKHLESEDNKGTSEEVINRADKASEELFNKLNKKEKEIKEKEAKSSLLETLGQTFFEQLKSSKNTTEVQDAVGSLILNIEVDADTVETEDYQYLFGYENTRQSLCKDISEEIFSFLEIRGPVIELSEKLDTAEGDESLEGKISEKLYTTTEILEKMLIVAGLSEYKMGELSEKAGLNLEDYRYKTFSEDLIEKFKTSEQNPGFTDDEKAILRAYCGLLGEKVDFDKDSSLSQDEALKVFADISKGVKGDSVENFVNAINYLYSLDFNSAKDFSIKIKDKAFREKISSSELINNFTNTAESFIRFANEKYEELSSEEKTHLDLFLQKSFEIPKKDISSVVLAGKLSPFFNHKQQFIAKDWAEFLNLFGYYLAVLGVKESSLKEYSKEKSDEYIATIEELLESDLNQIIENKEKYSELFYQVANNIDLAAFIVEDLKNSNLQKKKTEFLNFIRRLDNTQKTQLILALNKDSRLEIDNKENLSNIINALVPNKKYNYNKIRHEMRKAFRKRKEQPEDRFAVEEEGVITTAPPKTEKSVFMEKVEELGLPSQREPAESEEISVDTEAVPVKVDTESSEKAESSEDLKFSEFDNFVSSIKKGSFEEVTANDFLNYVSPFEKVSDFNSKDLTDFQKNIKEKLEMNVVTLKNAMSNEALSLLFGDLKLKQETVNIYKSILVRIGAIIYSKEKTARDASSDLSKYIKAAKNKNIDNELYKKVNNLTEDISADEAKEANIKSFEDSKLTPSKKSCEKIGNRANLSLYAFSLPSLNKNIKSLKKVSSKEYKALKELCNKGNRVDLISFVSEIISKYSEELSKDEIENFFSGNVDMPESLSNFLLEGFGNEFVRPYSIFLGTDVLDQNIISIIKDLEGEESDFHKYLSGQIKEIFSDRYSLAKKLFIALLGWNLDEGIYFDVEKSLIHVSKENSRLAFNDIKNKIGFASAKSGQEVLKGSVSLYEYDGELEQDIADYIKYYSDYYNGEYSKEFLNKIKLKSDIPSIDDITVIKTVDNLAKQDKSEEEIAIDISDFCKTIESINEARKGGGLKAYIDKDLFGTQKYKKFLTNSKASISKAIRSICDSDDRTLASVAAILFAPREVNFNAFLKGSFMAGLTEKQFSRSLKKLFEEFDIELESLEYLSKKPKEVELNTDAYYKALAQRILEKMDPRLILGTIVQSAFYDKSILDNDKEYEIVFSDDVIPVSRENFTEQLNMLAGLANESINELMGGEISDPVSTKTEEKSVKPPEEVQKNPSASEWSKMREKIGKPPKKLNMNKVKKKESESSLLSETFYEEEESFDKKSLFELLKESIEEESDVGKLNELLGDVIIYQQKNIIEAKEANSLKSKINEKINKPIFSQIKDWIEEKQKSFNDYLNEGVSDSRREADFGVILDEIEDLKLFISDDDFKSEDFQDIITLQINKKTKTPTKAEKQKLFSFLSSLFNEINKGLGYE